MSVTVSAIRRCLPVNKKGFVSVYALVLLNIVLLSALCLLAEASANHMAKQQMDRFDAQIVAIYRIKTRLHTISENESEDHTDDDSEENTEEDKRLMEESFYHKDVFISIVYEESYCDVTLDHLQMRVFYDWNQQIITDMVYF